MHIKKVKFNKPKVSPKMSEKKNKPKEYNKRKEIMKMR